MAQVGSAPTETTTAAGSSSGAGSVAGREQAMLDFARCMRGHGAAGFPDPARTASGTFGFASVAAVRKALRGNQRAFDACRRLLAQAGVTSRQNVSAFQAKMVEYARCMRGHGAPDFPDPSPNGMFGGRLKQLDRNAPGYRRADAACGRYRRAAMDVFSVGGGG